MPTGSTGPQDRQAHRIAMPSEAKRAVVRIGANYIRLFIALAVGVVLTPLLFAWLGKDGFGLISLLGA